MSDRMRAFKGAKVFDGNALINAAVCVGAAGLPTIADPEGLSRDAQITELNGGTILPGFVDLQVNGGGGVMLNDAPTLATIRTIAEAHHRLGTRGFLPTLITDTPAQTAQAIDAAVAAVDGGVPGVLGLHLEGPHLDRTRCGAHDPTLIRPMREADLHLLCRAAQCLPNLMVTLAPENVEMAQIEALAAAGVIVCLGHSDVDFDTAQQVFSAGAKGVTHLFNAMSGLSHRAPGLVGAALQTPGVSGGLIADGIHVHPAAMATALAAKQTPGDIYLVTDAMACAGSAATSFTLNGRTVTRQEGCLTLEDGTLAGADLTMARAVEVMVTNVDRPLDETLRRVTAAPAALLSSPGGAGCWPESLCGLIHLSDDFQTVTALDDLV